MRKRVEVGLGRAAALLGCLVVTLLVAIAPAHAAENADAELFVRAKAAYEEGAYGQAVAAYEELLQSRSGPFARGGAIYYNLGNAHLRNGDLGHAIAAYRRARALLPRNEDVTANLAFARRSTRDAVAPPEPSALWAHVFFWHRFLSQPELLSLLLLLNAVFWGIVAATLFLPRATAAASALRWSLGGVGVLLLLVAGSLALRWVAPMRVAVITPGEVGARAEPKASAAVRFPLHAGSEVRVDEEREGWLRISLPDGEPGWLARAEVDLVEE